MVSHTFARLAVQRCEGGQSDSSRSERVARAVSRWRRGLSGGERAAAGGQAGDAGCGERQLGVCAASVRRIREVALFQWRSYKNLQLINPRMDRVIDTYRNCSNMAHRTT